MSAFNIIAVIVWLAGVAFLYYAFRWRVEHTRNAERRFVYSPQKLWTIVGVLTAVGLVVLIFFNRQLDGYGGALIGAFGFAAFVLGLGKRFAGK